MKKFIAVSLVSLSFAACSTLTIQDSYVDDQGREHTCVAKRSAFGIGVSDVETNVCNSNTKIGNSDSSKSLADAIVNALANYVRATGDAQ